MRGRMRDSSSTTVSFTPWFTRAFRIVKAMNPAPIIATRAPSPTHDATARAWGNVQKLCTFLPSAPGTGAFTGEEPVAIKRLSYSISSPPSRMSLLVDASILSARAPSLASTFSAASLGGEAI